MYCKEGQARGVMQSLEVDFSSEELRAESPPKILIAIRDPKDRKQIQQYLPNTISVDQSNGREIADHSFDLCIMDEHTFNGNQRMLQKIKEEAAPIMLPMLLLAQEKSSARKNTGVLKFADDVIYVPVSQQVLQSRVQMMLKQRDYTLQLEEKNRQLEEQNEQLRLFKEAINATDEGVLISDASKENTPIIFSNKGFEQLTGYSEDEVIGQNCRFLQDDDRDQEVILQIRSLIDNEESGEVRLRNYRKDGSMFWNELSVAPIKNKSGETSHYVSIQQDVTELVEMQQQLKEEKIFIDAAIQSLPELFFVLDEEQNFVKWNNFKTELGYSDTEILQMDPIDLFQQEDRSTATSKITEVFKTGSAEVELKAKAKNEKVIPYYITSKKFQQGDKEFLAGTAINLTEIKKAQYELEQNREMLNALINQTETVIFVKDQDRKLQLVNEAYLDLFGLQRKEVIGKTEKKIFGQEVADKAADHDQKVLDHQQTLRIDKEVFTENEKRHFYTIKYPLKGVPGFENCLCCIATDITERKEAYRELQERVKEQRCLQNISSLDRDIDNVDKLLSEAVNYLPNGWQYPEITEAAIEFDGNSYTTPNFEDTRLTMSAEGSRNGDIPLKITVTYTEEKEQAKKNPFLKEERKLLDSITSTLSSQINRILALQRLGESKDRWEQLVEKNPSSVQLVSTDNIIKYINLAGAKLYGIEREKLIGKPFTEFISFEQDQLLRKRMSEVANGKSLGTQTYKINAKDGREKHVEMQSVVVKHENEQVLLVISQDKTDRFEYERQLERSLEEKRTLLQEVHHRVKNNMQVVSSMLHLQVLETDNEEVQRQLSDSQNRIKSMALIHEKLYQSDSLSKIDFGRYVDELITSLKKISPQSSRIEFDLEYDSFSLNVNQAVPCALIMNEVISNSQEHAFDEETQGTISIVLEETENKIKVNIWDNGEGMPDDWKERAEMSMGFTIVETLLQQLKAEYEFTNNDGFSFFFSFEKNELKGAVSSFE